MSDRDTLIREGLAALRERRTLSPEFFGLLMSLAAGRQAKARAQGITIKEDNTDLAGGFALWLADAPPKTCLIDSYGSLVRAYGKWATGDADPEGHELWSTLSGALRDLESEGKIERPDHQRPYHNQNGTRWYRPPNAGTASPLLDRKAVAAVFPQLSRKGPGDRVLKPSEARRIVAALLELAGGELTMKEIVDYARPHVPMMRILNESDLAPGEDGGPEDGRLERMAAAVVYPDRTAAVEEEIAYRAGKIWFEAGAVSRGKAAKIEGRRILCCYWIPHRIAQAKVKLEEFGSTSTVLDVVNDLTAIMGRYVPQPQRHHDQTEERSACLSIGLGILNELATVCSENGFCRAFYQGWTP